MSRLNTHLNKPKDQCLAVSATFSHLDCYHVSAEKHYGCRGCVARIEPDSKGMLNQTVNQLGEPNETTYKEPN